MKRFQLKIASVLAMVLVVASLAFVGCKATLEQGGAYAPIGQASDMPLFVADSAYQLAYTTLDTAFTVEKQNRDLLWKVSPTIKHTLDGIRPQAVTINSDYLKARTTYIANPTPANLSGVQAVLAKIQQLAVTAQSVLPKQ